MRRHRTGDVRTVTSERGLMCYHTVTSRVTGDGVQQPGAYVDIESVPEQAANHRIALALGNGRGQRGGKLPFLD